MHATDAEERTHVIGKGIRWTGPPSAARFGRQLRAAAVLATC